MPDSTINRTPAGWPYLDDNNFIDVIDDYSLELANKLQNSDADVAAAINAATTATQAAASINASFYAGSATVEVTAAAYAQMTVPLPAGRFTSVARMAVVANATNYDTRYVVRTYIQSTSAITIGVRHVDGTATTGSIPVSFIVIQSAA